MSILEITLLLLLMVVIGALWVRAEALRRQLATLQEEFQLYRLREGAPYVLATPPSRPTPGGVASLPPGTGRPSLRLIRQSGQQ